MKSKNTKGKNTNLKLGDRPRYLGRVRACVVGTGQKHRMVLKSVRYKTINLPIVDLKV